MLVELLIVINVIVIILFLVMFLKNRDDLIDLRRGTVGIDEHKEDIQKVGEIARKRTLVLEEFLESNSDDKKSIRASISSANEASKTRDTDIKTEIDTLHDSLFVKDAFGLGFKHLFKFTAVEFERLLNDEHNKLEIVKRYTTPLLAKMHKEEIADWKKEVETFRSIGGR